MLLPEIRIAEKGANLKILELTGEDFFLFTTDDI